MSDIDNKLVVIVGPTAIGKTAVGIELAAIIGGEIISADSMQVYRGMNIGTEKPSLEERGDIPHHLIDVVEPSEPFSVAVYQKMARETIREVQERGAFPILVGGTGLYVRAVIDRLEFPEGDGTSEVRRQLIQRAEREGAQALHDELARLDREAANAIHPENVRRVIRALEVVELTGEPFSKFRRKWRVRESVYQLRMFGLAMDRSKLYAMIDSRVYKQLDKGLLDEVKALINAGYEDFLTASQALGYKEFITYLKSESTLDEAVENLKRRTRHYAKRQLTWFRADPRVTWIDVGERPAIDIAKEMAGTLKAESFIS
ncbi:MAG: tRNA (adenosine(37)-N6)-dimethylallyltransferase MiaA [Actinobacteria bacterium]|nr:tRNA (adenosine(37)-N6)-dimethylallyltransferase MiaA [Actinomycetota bacterium]